MNLIKKIRERAKIAKKTIVLAEGTDERVIEAAGILQREKLSKVVLLGNEKMIKAKIDVLKVQGLEIINPENSDKSDEYASLLFELRKHKGMTLEQARELIKDPIWYGTLMVKNQDVDGMVAGANTATADVFRPAFQVVKTAPGMNIVSSAFIMIVSNCNLGKDGVMLFADCAINPNPDAKQLAEIAMASANTWRALVDDEPKVAMLSFSTKGSAKHELIDKVIEATDIVRKLAPELSIDGELQADAALVPNVAQKKAPTSKVAGAANVLVFPDLGAGNIGYKLVERLANAEAIGPITQGLAKPINDLSRGCSVNDIVNVVSITALQANMQ